MTLKKKLTNSKTTDFSTFFQKSKRGSKVRRNTKKKNEGLMKLKKSRLQFIQRGHLLSLHSDDSKKLLENESASMTSDASSPLIDNKSVAVGSPEKSFKISVNAPKSQTDDDIISDYEESISSRIDRFKNISSINKKSSSGVSEADSFLPEAVHERRDYELRIQGGGIDQLS